MLQKQVLLAIGNTLALFCKLLCLSPTSAAYNRHPELGVWQTFWVVKRARGGPGRGGGGGGGVGDGLPFAGHGPAGIARDARESPRPSSPTIGRTE